MDILQPRKRKKYVNNVVSIWPSFLSHQPILHNSEHGELWEQKRNIRKAGYKNSIRTLKRDKFYFLLYGRQHSTQTSQVWVEDGYWNEMCLRIRILYLKTQGHNTGLCVWMSSGVRGQNSVWSRTFHHTNLVERLSLIALSLFNSHHPSLNRGQSTHKHGSMVVNI